MVETQSKKYFGLPVYMYENIIRDYKCNDHNEYLCNLAMLLFNLCDGTELKFENIQYIDLINHLKSN